MNPAISLFELLNMKAAETEWVWDGVLPSSGISIIAGKPKTGKSTLLRCLALAMCRGESFLERGTHKGPVLYFALEEKISEVQKHYLDLGANGDEEIFFYFQTPGKDPFGFLKTEISSRKPSLIVIDPVFRFLEVKDSNDYQETNRALSKILEVARSSQAHIICSHHMNKGERAGPEGILGSTAIFGGVDSALILTRNATQRCLQSVQRYGDDLPETVLKYDEVSRRFVGAIPASVASKQRIESTIIDLLKGEPLLEETVIVSRVEGKTETTRSMLRELFNSGRLKRIGNGYKGSPYRYQIPQNAHPHIGNPKGDENPPMLFDEPSSAESPDAVMESWFQ